MHESVLNRRKENKKLTFTLTGACLAVMLTCALLTGIVSQTILSVVLLAMSCLLLLTRGVHLAFPIMMFYYDSFGTFAGMSVYRYFSLIFLLSVISNRGGVLVRKRQLAPVFIFLLYAFIVIGSEDVRRAIFAIVDVACVLFLVNSYLDTKEKLKSFFKIYVFTALCAYVTGTVINATVENLMEVNGQLVEVSRNYATFEDPNYAGLFYTVAIFSLLTLKLFNPKIRVVLVVALTAIVLTTLSITGLLVNILLWGIYLVVHRKLKPTTMICIALVAIILVGLYSYGLANPDAPVIGNFSYRVLDKLQALEQNDIGAVTTNRSDLSKQHMDIFWSQPIYKMFVGMNPTSPLIVDVDRFVGVAHNEYVDLFLNVGFIGAFVYLGYLATRLIHTFQGLRRQNEYNSCIFMIKMVWALYGMALTLFGDHRFMLLFFL